MRALTTFLFLLVNITMATAQTLHDFTLTGIDGKPLPMAQFKGRPVLVVNTASECGYTPQYEGLEKLWESYKAKCLIIVGVPSIGLWATILAALLSAVATYAMIRITARTLGGRTGDTLGACQQVAVIAFLIGASAA